MPTTDDYLASLDDVLTRLQNEVEALNRTTRELRETVDAAKEGGAGDAQPIQVQEP